MAQLQSPNMLRRTWWDGLELMLVKAMLEEWAMQIDYMAADGAVVTQIPLPVEAAMRKRGMSNGGNQ